MKGPPPTSFLAAMPRESIRNQTIQRLNFLAVPRCAARWEIFMFTVALAVLLVACHSGPPRERGNFRQSDLVEITNFDPTIRLDIRYATTNNFLHRPVYMQARAFLQRPAAEAVVRA